MPRKKTFQTFREAQKLGAYAEMPMLPEETQLQVRLSRNDRAQPFYALFAKDTLLLLMSGAGSIEFRGAPIRAFGLEPGDCVYVPAGTAHRLVHAEESVVLRYVPQSPLVEGIAWYCETCARELHREVWSTGERLSQEAYVEASTRFNADARRRTCAGCAAIHPPVELGGFGWEEAAGQLKQY
jgi:hypothetical protein